MGTFTHGTIPCMPEIRAALKRWEAARNGAVGAKRSAISFAPQERGAAATVFVHRFEGSGDGFRFGSHAGIRSGFFTATEEQNGYGRGEKDSGFHEVTTWGS